MAVNIWVKYHQNGKIEKIDTATDQRDARYLVGEYALVYRNSGIVWAGLKRDCPTTGR